ncbi:MAG: Uma2 family endonuclease [Chloroflexota bacterium]
MATLVGSRLTYVEFHDLPDDGILYELLDGAVVTRAAPTEPHQAVALELATRLKAHVDEGSLGIVCIGPLDVVLDEYNATLPDLLFIRTERAGILGHTGCFGPPDLVVEALSPTSVKRDLTDKLGIYERGGVQHYWVIDVAGERLRRFVLSAGRYVEQPVLSREDTLNSSLFPGLELPLRPIFDAAHWAQELAQRPQAPDVDLNRVRFLEQLHRQRRQQRERD